MATLKITLVKSAIGAKPNQKATLKALGLTGKMNQVVEHADSDSIKGMINVVKHLVKVEEK